MKKSRFSEPLPPVPTLVFEQALWQQGLRRVAGLDEAGRGALAGPVYAGAVILPPDHPQLSQELAAVRDSKQLSAKRRSTLAPCIQAYALDWGVGWAEAAEVDALGIAPASRLAFMRALTAMSKPADYLLLDYFRLPESDLGQEALVKGDRRSLSIACASILAKTSRDACMQALDATYPAYGFARHKGYGTAAHRAALAKLGACSQHRHSFRLLPKG